MAGDKKTVLVDKYRHCVPDWWLLRWGRRPLENWAESMVGESRRGSIYPLGYDRRTARCDRGDAASGEINRCAKSSAPVDSSTESS